MKEISSSSKFDRTFLERWYCEMIQEESSSLLLKVLYSCLSHIAYHVDIFEIAFSLEK